MTRKDENPHQPIEFKYSVRVDRSDPTDPTTNSMQRVLEAAAAFQRKLVGVIVQADDGQSPGAVMISVTVHGGADRAHLERLWRQHLEGYGLALDAC